MKSKKAPLQHVHKQLRKVVTEVDRHVQSGAFTGGEARVGVVLAGVRPLAPDSGRRAAWVALPA